MKTVTVEIKRDQYGFYRAYVDGHFIGEYFFKFQAKREIKEYIRNNLNIKKKPRFSKVYSAEVNIY